MSQASNVVRPWQETEISFTALNDYANPYTQVEVWVDFMHENGSVLRRPAFWDGGRNWRVRFAGPVAGSWTWRSYSSTDDKGLSGLSGRILVESGAESANKFYRHGFWRMSPGQR